MRPRNRKESRLGKDFRQTRELGRDESLYRRQARRLERAMRRASRQLDQQEIKQGMLE
jgi:hypothetical protein